MRVAQVSTLYEPVPPPRYGGVERVVGILTDALVADGHEVTLYASGDSTTAGTLEAACPRSLRESVDQKFRDFSVAIYMKMMADIARNFDAYDVVHFHTGFYHLLTAQQQRHRSLTTVHMPVTTEEPIGSAMSAFGDVPLVAISHDQQSHHPDLDWRGVVHHGIPQDQYVLGKGDGDYLLFLGRIAPSKRPDRAIEIAKRAGIPLKIAAKVDDVFVEYFDEVVRPHVDGQAVEFLGEVTDGEKQALYGGATALLFPIDWNEPFGLVMIEAMACGTPTIAWQMGSVDEIITDGLNGIKVTSTSDAVAAVTAASQLPREGVRADFDRRFTADVMARRYVELYGRLLAGDS